MYVVGNVITLFGDLDLDMCKTYVEQHIVISCVAIID